MHWEALYHLGTFIELYVHIPQAVLHPKTAHLSGATKQSVKLYTVPFLTPSFNFLIEIRTFCRLDRSSRSVHLSVS